jgi:serine/threonine protein kinase
MQSPPFRVGEYQVKYVGFLGKGTYGAVVRVIAIAPDGRETPAALRVSSSFDADAIVARYQLLSDRYAGFVPRYMAYQRWLYLAELPEILKAVRRPKDNSFLGLLTEFGSQGTIDDVLKDSPHPVGDPWWATVALRLLGFFTMAQREVGFEHRDLKPSNVVFQNDLPLVIDYDTVHFELLEEILEPLTGTIHWFPPEFQRVRHYRISNEDYYTKADMLKEPLGAYDNWSLGLMLLDVMLAPRIHREIHRYVSTQYDQVENMRSFRKFTSQLLKAVHDEPAPNDTAFTEDVRRSMAAFPPGARDLFRLLLARDSRARVLRNNACDVFRTNAWLRSAPGYNDFMYDYGYRIAAPFPNIRWSVSFCIGAPLRCGACGGRDHLHMCATTGLVVCGERCWDAIKTIV